MEFMLPIFEILISSQFSQLKRSEEIHNRLLRVLLSGGGFESICQTLSELLGNPVLLMDKFGNKIAGAPPVQTTQNFGELVEVWSKANRDVFDLNPNCAHRLNLNLKDVTQLLVPVSIQASIAINGFLVVMENIKPLDEQDLGGLEYAGTIAALEYAKEKAVFAAGRPVKGEILEDLITGSFKSEEVVIRRAGFFNFKFLREIGCLNCCSGWF